MYLILLLTVFALTGVFALQNDGTQHFTLLGYAWTLHTWVPTAIGVGMASALLMLHMSHTGLGSRLREIGHGRALDEHRDTIDELRAANARLREDLAAARGEARGAARTEPGKSSLLEEVRTLPARLSGRSST